MAEAIFQAIACTELTVAEILSSVTLATGSITLDTGDLNVTAGDVNCATLHCDAGTGTDNHGFCKMDKTTGAITGGHNAFGTISEGGATGDNCDYWYTFNDKDNNAVKIPAFDA